MLGLSDQNIATNPQCYKDTEDWSRRSSSLLCGGTDGHEPMTPGRRPTRAGKNSLESFLLAPPTPRSTIFLLKFWFGEELGPGNLPPKLAPDQSHP